MSNISKGIDMLIHCITQLENITGQSAEVQKPAKQPKQPQKQQETLPDIVKHFSKCDLRVTQVKTCEHVKDFPKLLFMNLDCGNGENRTFVAGMAEYYKPDELIGKKIVTIMNLKARTMCNSAIQSQAMLFAGSVQNGDTRTVKLCFPDDSTPLGTRVVLEGFEELQKVEGEPKKSLDKVFEVLKVQQKAMCLGNLFLTAAGKRVSCDMPDGASLG